MVKPTPSTPKPRPHGLTLRLSMVKAGKRMGPKSPRARPQPSMPKLPWNDKEPK
jgi:hypothetical protein